MEGGNLMELQTQAKNYRQEMQSTEEAGEKVFPGKNPQIVVSPEIIYIQLVRVCVCV